MALVLSLHDGSDFYVDTERFIVCEVKSETDFFVRRDSTGEKFAITEKKATEVMSDVWISAGEYVQMLMVRVAIDAPRVKKVLRGDLYRKPITQKVEQVRP